MEIIRDSTPIGCECGGASRRMRNVEVAKRWRDRLPRALKRRGNSMSLQRSLAAPASPARYFGVTALTVWK